MKPKVKPIDMEEIKRIVEDMVNKSRKKPKKEIVYKIIDSDDILLNAKPYESQWIRDQQEDMRKWLQEINRK